MKRDLAFHRVIVGISSLCELLGLGFFLCQEAQKRRSLRFVGWGLKSLPKVLDVFLGDELLQGCVHDHSPVCTNKMGIFLPDLDQNYRLI
jgi:hypothetical protein